MFLRAWCGSAWISCVALDQILHLSCLCLLSVKGQKCPNLKASVEIQWDRWAHGPQFMSAGSKMECFRVLSSIYCEPRAKVWALFFYMLSSVLPLDSWLVFFCHGTWGLIAHNNLGLPSLGSSKSPLPNSFSLSLGNKWCQRKHFIFTYFSYIHWHALSLISWWSPVMDFRRDLSPFLTINLSL